MNTCAISDSFCADIQDLFISKSGSIGYKYRYTRKAKNLRSSPENSRIEVTKNTLSELFRDITSIAMLLIT